MGDLDHSKAVLRDLPKFTTILLDSSFNRNRTDSTPWDGPTAAAIAGLPGGEQRFWGVPFLLGTESSHENGLVVAANERSIQSVNLTEAESRLRDLDVAQAFVEQTRNQVLLQGGLSALAQSNIQNQTALTLLGG